LLLFILSFCLFLSLLFLHSYKADEYGHLALTVLDAYDLRPLSGAEVILPEVGLRGSTDHHGKLSFFGIPLLKNPVQNALLPQSWGECSLLVYKDGYRDYALFHMQLDPNRIRRGPTVYLFPDTEESDGPISVIESPRDPWIEELLDLYRPLPE